MIDLNETRRTPLYESIYRQLRGEISAGQRRTGEKLPSKRTLAAQLGVSINTVAGAYRQLESEGYIEARARSGFYVLPLADLIPGETPAPSGPVPDASSAPEVDFAVGAVDERLFPMTVWQRLTRACLNSPDILRRSEPQGDRGLREEIARYLARARGVRCTPEQIVIGTGTDALLRALGGISPESCTFVVENPSYHRADSHFLRMGHRVLPAQMDGRGVTVAPLEGLDDAVVYTAPSHQYPLGFAMPMGRRTELLAWCARGRFRYVIEDDYDSEFRYNARPLPSLQSIDRADRVIYLGTMSGVISPALRIGYMVLPPLLLARLRADRTGCGVPIPQPAAGAHRAAAALFRTPAPRRRPGGYLPAGARGQRVGRPGPVREGSGGGRPGVADLPLLHGPGAGGIPRRGAPGLRESGAGADAPGRGAAGAGLVALKNIPK